jgi:hypothetical protein
MLSRIKLIFFGVLVVLCMGNSCRQETAQNVLNVFLTEIAETTAGAIVESLVDGETP